MLKLFSKIYFIGALLLISCDCVVHHQGYVIDSKTDKPITGATIELAKRKFKTDSLGYFEINFITGFCPKVEITVTKENYKKALITKEIEKNEVIYRMSKGSEDSPNSTEFKVKSGNIYFYLEEIDSKF
jgi:hypothetical protein